MCLSLIRMIISGSFLGTNLLFFLNYGCAGSSLLCRLSLVAVSGGLLGVVVCGLLTAVASLV